MNLDTQQEAQLKQFKSILSKDFPEEVKDDNLMYRFLKARKWVLNDAETMFRNRMKWYLEIQPNKIKEEDVASEIKDGKIFRRRFYNFPLLRF